MPSQTCGNQTTTQCPHKHDAENENKTVSLSYFAVAKCIQNEQKVLVTSCIRASIEGTWKEKTKILKCNLDVRERVYTQISDKCYESKKWKGASEMRKERSDRILETTPDLK
jgi:hypothetical protein